MTSSRSSTASTTWRRSRASELAAGPQPVDDPGDGVPVLALARLDEVAQHCRLDRHQRLGARRAPAHERVVHEVVDRHARVLREALEHRHRVLEPRGLDLAGERAVLWWDLHGPDPKAAQRTRDTMRQVVWTARARGALRRCAGFLFLACLRGRARRLTVDAARARGPAAAARAARATGGAGGVDTAAAAKAAN